MFRYFQRYKCVLELSDSSYCKAKVSTTWSCPGCVPVFSPQVMKCKVSSKKMNMNFTSLVLFVKALYHLNNFLSVDNYLNVIIELLLFIYGTFVFLMFSIDVG